MDALPLGTMRLHIGVFDHVSHVRGAWTVQHERYYRSLCEPGEMLCVRSSTTDLGIRGFQSKKYYQPPQHPCVDHVDLDIPAYQVHRGYLNAQRTSVHIYVQECYDCLYVLDKKYALWSLRETAL